MASILIFEDDNDLRLTMKRMLQFEGYEVLDAPNGDIGIRLYRETPADLIITDIFMPDKEGIQTIIELKKEDPNVKIIAISGGGNKGSLNYLNSAEKLGVEKTFQKPVDVDVLLDGIKQILDN